MRLLLSIDDADRIRARADVGDLNWVGDDPVAKSYIPSTMETRLLRIEQDGVEYGAFYVVYYPLSEDDSAQVFWDTLHLGIHGVYFLPAEEINKRIEMKTSRLGAW